MVEDGKPREVFRSKRAPFKDMYDELLKDLVEPVQGSSFVEHLFVGQWQQQQFIELKDNLPKDSVILVMNYGKNHTVRYQDEPKSVFFTAKQITVHPVVAFYHSLDGEVNRKRKITDVNTLSGCRKLHQFVNTNTPYQLLVKRLSCYCTNCRNGREKDCPNKDYTGPFEERGIKPTNALHRLLKTRSTQRSTHESLQNTPDHQAEQTSKRSCSPATVTTQKSETRHVSQPTDSTASMKATDSLSYWDKLMKCKTYTDVQQATVDTELTHLPSLPEVTFVTHKRVVDNSALKLLPDEVQSLGLLPTSIYGDGNCLPRCASLLVYGDEERHLDIRARIILELVVNKVKYLDDRFLKEGSDLSLGKKNFARQFAMFSEHYSGEELTDLAVQRLFRAEVLSLCQSGTYMGIWQLASLSNPSD